MTTTNNLRTIPNYSNYLISDKGIIYRLYPTEVGLLCAELPTKTSYNGYVNVCLTNDNNEKHWFNIGRLVLMAHKADSYFDGAECDHIDRNPLNNDVNNLRWVTHADNCKNRRPRTEVEKDRPLYLIFDNGAVEMYCSRSTTNIPSATLSRILSGQHSQKYKCHGFYYNRLCEQSAEV